MDFPYISKELLERLDDDFDIRRIVGNASYTKDYLEGIQSVLDYLHSRYDDQLKTDEEDNG